MALFNVERVDESSAVVGELGPGRFVLSRLGLTIRDDGVMSGRRCGRCRAGWAGAGGSGRQRLHHRPNQFRRGDGGAFGSVRTSRSLVIQRDTSARALRSGQRGLIRAMVRMPVTHGPTDATLQCDGGADRITVPSSSNQGAQNESTRRGSWVRPTSHWWGVSIDWGDGRNAAAAKPARLEASQHTR